MLRERARCVKQKYQMPREISSFLEQSAINGMYIIPIRLLLANTNEEFSD